MTNPNDPAFVETKEQADDGIHAYIVRAGLTKREYFAAMAMQGIISGMQTRAVDSAAQRKEWEGIARSAVLWADALIAELNK